MTRRGRRIKKIALVRSAAASRTTMSSVYFAGSVLLMPYLLSIFRMVRGGLVSHKNARACGRERPNCAGIQRTHYRLRREKMGLFQFGLWAYKSIVSPPRE